MKHRILFALLFLSYSSVYAQDAKKEAEAAKTKMDVFASKTGVIMKFSDVKLTPLKTAYEAVETRIRKVSSGTTTSYFFQIEKNGKYSNPTASIEYSDLLEVIKAFNTLKSSVAGDAGSSSDYLENKFMTVDGFQLGYYVSKGKTTWYLRLEKYGSDNTLFIDDPSSIETAFNEAKTKIDAMKG